MMKRVALNTAVNICKELPADCPPSLMEAVPLLCNLLQYEDRQVGFCFSRLKSFIEVVLKFVSPSLLTAWQ